jgi:hypothetical protein
MANAFDWYKQLPGWAKGLMVTTAGGVVIYMGYKIYSGVRQAIRKSQAAQSIKDVAGERKDLENSGVNASFGNSDYQGWASGIQTQFDGCDFSIPISFLPGKDLSYSGTFLYNILDKFKNNVDFLKLVEAWGIRTYSGCLGTGNTTNVNLYAAVADELESGEITIINDLLKSKGITYSF